MDPRRDVSEYLTDADAHGFTVEGVLHTHSHADFLAGHLEMAARTGAWIGYGRLAKPSTPSTRWSAPYGRDLPEQIRPGRVPEVPRRVCARR